jgi:hypothetical protein
MRPWINVFVRSIAATCGFFDGLDVVPRPGAATESDS